MKLIVGLGNPGKEYVNTRHNVGFSIIDAYANRHHLTIDKTKFNGRFVEFIYQGEKIILLKPLSYMNLSGEVVQKFVDYYKIPIENILIVHDDLDLSLGTYKLKANGSSGGHNGLKNIELHLATREYKRLKIGISNNKDIDTKDYVLGTFSMEEQKILASIQDTILNIIDDSITHSFSSLMNQYNRKG